MSGRHELPAAILGVAALLLVGCGGDAEPADTMRRTPFSEACRLLNEGVPWPSIAPRLVEEFWPGEPGFNERPDVEASAAVNQARAQGCGE